jgi:seryl-tRNA synthetase
MKIQFIRENIELVKKNQCQRYNDPLIIDEVMDFDSRWREIIGKTNDWRKDKKMFNCCFKNAPNDTTIDLNNLNDENYLDDFRNGKIDVKLLTRGQLKTIGKDINNIISKNEKFMNVLLNKRDSLISQLGNMLYKDVPVDNNEDNNIIVDQFKPDYDKLNPSFPDLPLDHVALFDKLGFVDIKNANKICGNRGYFLKGFGVRLNQALLSYGMDLMVKNDYQLMETPHFVNAEMMGKISQLCDYDETLYKLDGYDKYLIATSEQPMTAYFSNTSVCSKNLPIKFGGYSTCYRKETGRGGAHTLGIYRVHQFQKLEQFCVTHPDKSWEMFHKMINISKELYKSLGFEYRVVNIVSGALNDAASMKYDLEAYYRGSKKYCELVSCTNVLDYFSHKIGLTNYSEKDKVPHMLNCTLCANTRVLCALVEAYQTKDGLIIPEVLRPYLGNVEFVPFAN